jgi:UDPglucose 6-dehydrogenase
MEGARVKLPQVEYTRDAYGVAAGSDAVVLVTEWNEFRRLDLGRLKNSMRTPVLIDGRNIYDPAAMRSLGFTYRGIGRD